MRDSWFRALVGVIALGVMAITIELAPISRNAEIKYQCALKGSRMGGKLDTKAREKLASISGLDDLRIDILCYDWSGIRGAH
ncbi:hypothetical protein [Prochlorococcus sp. MIT 1341]|uniref:hypothetical protein n=1 Tax=Prochlorococcus sp. MIT 1341 TaxID=3096221 RepID=UPI002A75F04B|nr:hypothetical protein [Prochlorococcus sp. MIT 1341]